MKKIILIILVLLQATACSLIKPSGDEPNASSSFYIEILDEKIGVYTKPNDDREWVRAIYKGEIYECIDTYDDEYYHWYCIGKNEWIKDADGTRVKKSNKGSNKEDNTPANTSSSFYIEILDEKIGVYTKPNDDREWVRAIYKGEIYECIDTYDDEYYHWYCIGKNEWIKDADGTRVKKSNKESNDEYNENMLYQIRVKTEIRIRPTASTSGDIIGHVYKNDVCNVYEVKNVNGYTWYRIGKDMWIADDGTWTERISDNTSNQNNNQENKSNDSENNLNQNETTDYEQYETEYQWCYNEAKIMAENNCSKQYMLDYLWYNEKIVNEVIQNLSIDFNENCKKYYSNLLNHTLYEGDLYFRKELEKALFTKTNIQYAFASIDVDWEEKLAKIYDGYSKFMTKEEIIKEAKDYNFSEEVIKNMAFDEICLLESELISNLPKEMENKLLEAGYSESNIKYVKSKIDWDFVIEDRVRELLQVQGPNSKITNLSITDEEIQKTLLYDGFNNTQVNYGMEYVKKLRR